MALNATELSIIIGNLGDAGDDIIRQAAELEAMEQELASKHEALIADLSANWTFQEILAAAERGKVHAF